jgi:uncharacterized membrane protein YjfL (UPF0719 family)
LAHRRAEPHTSPAMPWGDSPELSAIASGTRLAPLVVAIVPRQSLSAMFAGASLMYTHAHKHDVSLSELFRWSGRACAAILVITWFVFVVLELFRSGPPTAVGSAYQAAVLAAVFVGYAIGWKRQLAGGIIVIFGTLAFFAENVLLVGVPPWPGAAWFAVPGILYLLALSFDHRHQRRWVSVHQKRE